MLRRAKKPPTARPAKQQPKQLTGHKARVAANEAKVLAERKAKRLKALARETAPPRRLVNLKWEPDVFTDETIDLQGRKIRRQEGGNSWTLGSALPMRGRHAWRCRIDHTHNNRGGLFIGVCDSGGTFARVFCPGTGSLHCIGLGQLAPDGRRRARHEYAGAGGPAWATSARCRARRTDLWSKSSSTSTVVSYFSASTGVQYSQGSWDCRERTSFAPAWACTGRVIR